MWAATRLGSWFASLQLSGGVQRWHLVSMVVELPDVEYASRMQSGNVSLIHCYSSCEQHCYMYIELIDFLFYFQKTLLYASLARPFTIDRLLKQVIIPSGCILNQLKRLFIAGLFANVSAASCWTSVVWASFLKGFWCPMDFGQGAPRPTLPRIWAY